LFDRAFPGVPRPTYDEHVAAKLRILNAVKAAG
jgi:hypothetical protein